MDLNQYLSNKKYAESLTEYVRRQSREVYIGEVPLGGSNPIRVQSMTTTDTMDTAATVAQSIRMIEAGCEYVRITAPSLKEAENLRNIKDALRRQGYNTPLIADIHYTPNAAELAAKIVEKVRVNPGNYIDKKKFEQKEYTDLEYEAEMERIRTRFSPLVKICRDHGTAMRIGANHGSLSDRIMNRYGDTPLGMVESAMEFLRICEDLSYYNVVLSMKSSNPQVMIQAYRLLVARMNQEGMNYPLHLGVTEAGEAEEGRIKSAMGIGALLEDGLGDTIRVSLTEPPENEIPVARALADRYHRRAQAAAAGPERERITIASPEALEAYEPFVCRRRISHEVYNLGGSNVPRVIADLSHIPDLDPIHLRAVGFIYDPVSDKWNMREQGADFLYLGKYAPPFMLPNGTKGICDLDTWITLEDRENHFPLMDAAAYLSPASQRSATLNFVQARAEEDLTEELLHALQQDRTAVLVLETQREEAMTTLRQAFLQLQYTGTDCPVVVRRVYENTDPQTFILHVSTDLGGLLTDGYGDGGFVDWNSGTENRLNDVRILNDTVFYILQASRTRISKTEYISCPSCGRTLFDLQDTTAQIRKKTDHLKGVKIAIMGCIVNGPGEMADADYGYVGTGPGKITLYRGREVVKRNIDSRHALDELINLIREDGLWIEPQPLIPETA